MADALLEMLETDRIKRDWKPTAEAEESRDPPLTRTGPFHEVIDDMDTSALTRLTMTGSSYPCNVRVEFSRSEGCKLEVYADDPAWVSSTFARLSDEIDRRVPKWSSIRSVYAAIAISLVLLVALDIVIAPYFPAKDHMTNVLAASVIIDYVLALPIGPAVYYGIKRWLPGFEVTEGESRGARVFALVGGTLLALAASVVANLLTR